MMHDETRAYSHALLTIAAVSGSANTAATYTRAANSLALTTPRNNDDRNLPGYTGQRESA